MSDLLSFPKKVEGINYLDNSPVSVEIANGKIVRVERLNRLSEANEQLFIAPGLIDIQVNGFLSVSFSLEGTVNSKSGAGELSTADVKKVTEALWEGGVTTYFPTLTTNRHDLLLKNTAMLKKAMDNPAIMGSIPGFHLEGPYISPEDGYRGAHPIEFVRKPDWNEFLELYNTAGEKILLVTLAPEIDGAIEFIKKCRKRGIVVSLGHHNGSAEMIKQAIDNGAGLATHLGNGCAKIINRHLNPMWPQLADDRLMISIICDGFHLTPEMIQVFYKVKGSDNIIITSDITSYAGLPPGEYKIKTGETIVKTSEGRVSVAGEGGTLYGSASPLVKGVGHIMKVTGCTLAQAIQMASTNPAGLHHLNDRGKLEPGKRADIILFTLDDFKIMIDKTIVEGKIVVQSK
jgi:N-acetylglucosamine-6-phosphate deacetylase